MWRLQYSVLTLLCARADRAVVTNNGHAFSHRARSDGAAAACSIPGRTDQQCMGRWRRHLDPNIRKCQWLPAEDALLKAKYDEHGPQWSHISKFLDGRTAQQCRARWFQISPLTFEGRGPAAPRHGNSRKDRIERHKDGATIQASARALLEQMEQSGELPTDQPNALRQGGADGPGSSDRARDAAPPRRSWRSHGASRRAVP